MNFSRLTRIFVSLCLFSIYTASLAAPSVVAFDKIEELKSGTSVRITLPSLSSSTAIPGQIVSGTCTSGVEVKGVTFVNPGAPVKMRVSNVQAPGNVGKPGMLTLEAVSLTAIDGTEVPLTGGIMSMTGEDSNTKSLLLGLFICILFLFQKGGDATFAPGTTVDAFVANSVDIEV